MTIKDNSEFIHASKEEGYNNEGKLAVDSPNHLSLHYTETPDPETLFCVNCNKIVLLAHRIQHLNSCISRCLICKKFRYNKRLCRNCGKENNKPKLSYSSVHKQFQSIKVYNPRLQKDVVGCKCNCGQVFLNRSTTNLHVHLSRFHPQIYIQVKTEDEIAREKVKKSMKLEEHVCKMIK